MAHIKTINHCQLDKRTHNARMRTVIDSIETKLMKFHCVMSIVNQRLAENLVEIILLSFTVVSTSVSLNNKNSELINNRELFEKNDVVINLDVTNIIISAAI